MAAAAEEARDVPRASSATMKLLSGSTARRPDVPSGAVDARAPGDATRDEIVAVIALATISDSLASTFLADHECAVAV